MTVILWLIPFFIKNKDFSLKRGHLVVTSMTYIVGSIFLKGGVMKAPKRVVKADPRNMKDSRKDLKKKEDPKMTEYRILQNIMHLLTNSTVQMKDPNVLYQTAYSLHEIGEYCLPKIEKLAKDLGFDKEVKKSKEVAKKEAVNA